LKNSSRFWNQKLHAKIEYDSFKLSKTLNNLSIVDDFFAAAVLADSFSHLMELVVLFLLRKQIRTHCDDVSKLPNHSTSSLHFFQYCIILLIVLPVLSNTHPLVFQLSVVVAFLIYYHPNCPKKFQLPTMFFLPYRYNKTICNFILQHNVHLFLLFKLINELRIDSLKTKFR
jgi:hypothetical protein